jgi:hypothetical protein
MTRRALTASGRRLDGERSFGDHHRHSCGRSVRVGDETANSSRTQSEARAGGAPDSRENDRSAARDVAHERRKAAGARGADLSRPFGAARIAAEASASGQRRLREPTAPGRSPASKAVRDIGGRREYLDSDSRWKPYSALTATGRPGKTSPAVGAGSAEPTHRRTRCRSAGRTGAMSAGIIGPPRASWVGSATATPPRVRVGTAGAAIVLAAGPHRGGSRQPWDRRSDAACHVIGACTFDAS